MNEPNQTPDDDVTVETPSFESVPLYDTDDPGFDTPGAAAKGPKYTCAITGRAVRRRDAMRLIDIRPELAERLRRDHPELSPHALISREAMAEVRAEVIEDILLQEHGEISDLERTVIESLARQETVSENVEEEFEDKRTFGERMSDGLASFGGSWMFIISFGIAMTIWMIINVILGDKKAFDPFPFILLNLCLSCLAAVQAPIIMMSQKRQEQKDRMRSLNDYRVNLKAELEIRHLHEKMDHLIKRQWERLAAIQRIQIELLEEMAGRRKAAKPPAEQ